MEPQQQKYHFVLVHGAWCFYRLIDGLQRGGHRVTAMHGHGRCGPAPCRSGLHRHIRAVQPACDGLLRIPPHGFRPFQGGVDRAQHGRVKLHTCMPVMERFSHKIGLVIFVEAVVTPSGASLMDSGKLTKLLFNDTPNSKALEYNFGDGLDKPPTSFGISKPQLKEFFYTDWNSEDVVLGSILVRPSPIWMLGLPTTFSKDKFGQVLVVYVKYLCDKTMPILAQDWIIENLDPFKEVVEIDGGHFDFHLNVDAFT